MDKGTALNKRVAALFEKAGFETMPNSQSTAEYEVQLSAYKRIPVDLFARDRQLGVTIIGSNKSGRRDRWTEHVNSYKTLGQKAGANKVLFVVTGTELEDQEKRHILDEGMYFWTEEELSYYEAVADAIKEFTRFEIIHALGLHTNEEKDTHKVLALRVWRMPVNS